MVVSGALRSKRCTGLPRSSTRTSAIAAPAREGPERPRRAAARSASGAPQVAQNLIPGATDDAQRGQLGPEPGAVSRRPQWGQKGCSPLARPPQKGQEIASLWATVERAAARVPGTPAAPPAAVSPPLPAPPEPAEALRPVDLLMGLPQPIQ